jgi:hypothetical protein
MVPVVREKEMAAMLIVDENRYQKIRHGPCIRSAGSIHNKKLMVTSEYTINQIKTSSHFI